MGGSAFHALPLFPTVRASLSRERADLVCHARVAQRERYSRVDVPRNRAFAGPRQSLAGRRDWDQYSRRGRNIRGAFMLKRSMLAASLAVVLAVAPASAGSGVNVGSLNCKVAGGSGFIFGSTKSLSCLFT